MKISRVGFAAVLASSALWAQQYTITTVAGGAPPRTPAPALNMSIGQPNTVATDRAGNVYFASSNCVFKLDVQGVITRVAGNSRPGFSGDGGPAVNAQLNSPSGMAVDGAGNLYIADGGNSRVRRVSPEGTMTTVAGDGTNGYGGDGGPASRAQLNWPSSVAIDSAGNLYISDTYNFRIRRVTLDGVITTVAGNGERGSSGDGGSATAAQLSWSRAIAIDAAGNLYIGGISGSPGESPIRKVSPEGLITTYGFGDVLSLALDEAGYLYFAIAYNPNVYRLSPGGFSFESPGILFAGNEGREEGFSGDGGPATRASLNWNLAVAADRAGNLYIADTYNGRIRKVSRDGIINTIAGNGASSFPGDGGPAAEVSLDPAGLAVDAAGNVYVAEPSNARIRKVSPDGVINTVAGIGTAGFSGDGGLAVSAELSWPGDVAVDRAGNLYIADTGNCRVRKVSSEGISTTVVGSGACGHVDGVLAQEAGLVPRRVVIDDSGNLYITEDFSVRRLWPNGIVSTVVENRYDCPVQPSVGFCASYYGITSMAVDAAGNIYFADSCRVRRVTPDVTRTVTPGKVTNTLVGNGTCGHVDGIPAADTQLAFPASLLLDNSGNLFIGDNASVRRLTPDGLLSTIAGTGVAGYSGDGGLANDAQLSRVAGLAMDAAGNIYVSGPNAVRRLQPVH